MNIFSTILLPAFLSPLFPLFLPHLFLAGLFYRCTLKFEKKKKKRKKASSECIYNIQDYIYIFTWVGHKSRVSKRTWGTAYRVCHTFGNQTQRLWRGSLKNRREDKKHQTPTCLGKDCTRSLASCLSSRWHYRIALLLLAPMTGTRAGLEETQRWRHGKEIPSRVLCPQSRWWRQAVCRVCPWHQFL